MSEGSRTRRLCIAGNWKMNHGPAEARGFFAKLAELVPELRRPAHESSQDFWIFPPALTVTEAVATIDKLKLSTCQIGVQNGHAEKSGAFTGELSASMILESGARGVLVGHSERRQYFGETDQSAAKRAQGLVQQGLFTIACLGETKAQRDAGQTKAVLTAQTKAYLEAVDARYLAGPQGGVHDVGATTPQVVFAYEPVWAIGTGVNATPEQAVEAHQILRTLVTQAFGTECGQAVRILYGGSVTPQNAGELLALPDVDGVLVGGASLKPEVFTAIWAAGLRVASRT